MVGAPDLLPTLTTERLTLRPHGPDDAAGLLEVWGDPVVTRYIGGRPSSAEECWSRLLRYVGHWAVQGFGYWAVVDSRSGLYLGDVGFADFRRALAPPLSGWEMGWVLRTAAAGQGYATEAAEAALAWAEAHGAPGFSCIVHPGNEASLRVAAKLGFREERRESYHGEPVVVLTRPATR